MRWRTFHRDHEKEAADDVEHTSQADAQSLPIVSILTPPFAISGDRAHPSEAVLRPADAVLNTRDIEEALRKEDEEARSQARTEFEKAFLGLDVGPTFSSSAAASPYIGLPAPPRGPRKVSQQRTTRASRQKPSSASSNKEVSSRPSDVGEEREVAMDAQRSSPSFSPVAVPSPTDASVPSIKDFVSGSGSSLRADVMNALNMKGSPSSDEFPQTLTIGSDLYTARDSTSSASYAQVGSSSSTVRESKISAGAQPHPRPLLYRSSSSSRDSDFSHSSYDPASTVDEPRISISSTIYPSSVYDTSSLPLPQDLFYDRSAAEHRSSLSYSEADESGVRSVHPTSINDPSSHAASAPGNSFQRLESPVPERPLSYDSSHIDGFVRQDFSRRPLSATSRRSSPGTKPALPTAPKPDFRRSRSAQPPAKVSTPSKPTSQTLSPQNVGNTPIYLMPSDPVRAASLPPTTNRLSPQERADLIRKTRKLTQVLGQTPSPVSRSPDTADDLMLDNCLLPMVPPRKVHPRAAHSISVAPVLTLPTNIGSSNDQYLVTGAAEKTATLSPMTFRHNNSGNDSDDSVSPYESPAAQTPMSSSKKRGENVSVRSPTIISARDSFMELSDGDGHEHEHGHGLMRFPSTYSLAISLTEDQKNEVERRRKRERLAKLHRFLGSRIPSELIFGPNAMGLPLPPTVLNAPSTNYTLADAEPSDSKKLWVIGKRRNSLASSDPLERLGDIDRIKEHLSDKEKAVVVKRALKMEKMFGEQPPQDLFLNDQIRQAANKQASKPARSAPTSPVSKNEKLKRKQTKHSRPGTAESTRRLLGPDGGPDGEFAELSFSTVDATSASDVYFSYRSSLTSLSNIVDNDDRRSLVELHEYINEGSSPAEGKDNQDWDTRSSIRSERRRSLPSRASQISLASQFTIAEAKADATPFEVRRRRAAKLSHFFGVSYRNLFGEVLDSIEMGVREEEGKGSLNAEEAKDLLAQLSKLKKRRDELS